MENVEEILDRESTSFSVLTKVPTDVILSVLEKMRKDFQIDENGQKSYLAKYEFKNMGDLTDRRNKKVKLIKKVFEEILDTQAEVFTENLYKKSNLISKYCLTKDSCVEVFLSDDNLSKKLINEEPHSILELDEFINLKSKFSREFYRIFRQFRNDGKVVIKKEDLLTSLRVPNSYDDFDFIDKVLNPSFEELKKYFDNLVFDNLEPSGTGELPVVCEFSFKKHEEKDLSKTSKVRKKEELELLKHIMNS